MSAIDGNIAMLALEFEEKIEKIMKEEEAKLLEEKSRQEKKDFRNTD